MRFYFTSYGANVFHLAIRQKVVGHILLTRLKIINDQQKFDSLGMAPVSVIPEFQGQGIGAQLIEYSHQVARALGHTSIILLGHEHYYPKFGYRQAHLFDIELPFEVPQENCMAIELVENGLSGISGVVAYPEEFNG